MPWGSRGSRLEAGGLAACSSTQRAPDRRFPCRRIPPAQVLPCATYYKRQGYPLKKIVEYARNRDFTDMMVR